MELGEKLYILRKEKGLTLEQVGDFVGVGKSTVRKWERGIIENMRRDKVAKLAQCLGVTPAYLMGWEIVNSGISIIGNENSHNTINHSLTPLTENLAEIEKELIYICSRLNTKQKNELLSFAYNLESKAEK